MQSTSKQSDRQPMTFTDKQGDTWDLQLSMLDAENIDHSLDFEHLTNNQHTFLKLTNDDIGLVLTDTPAVCHMAWLICQNRTPIDKPGQEPLTRDQFLSRIRGREVVVNLRLAFWETFADFFPEKRTLVSSLPDLIKGIENGQTELVNNLRDNLPKISRRLSREFIESIETGDQSIN